MYAETKHGNTTFVFIRSYIRSVQTIGDRGKKLVYEILYFFI